MTPKLWWWEAGTQGGVTHSEARARSNAADAAVGQHCHAKVALVLLGFNRGNLEPLYVHTNVAYKGILRNGHVKWVPAGAGTKGAA